MTATQTTNPYVNNPEAPMYQNAAPKKNRAAKIMAWVMGVIFLLGIGLVGLNYWSIGAIEKMDTELAIETCQEDIEDQAKHPGGITYPEPIEATTEQTYEDDARTYNAQGEVDLMNGFGVPVRKQYACTAVIGDEGLRTSYALIH